MKNYTNSDYALNKYSEGIVYRFADGTVTVTLEDYLAENPGKTAEDFHILKQLSDNDYYESQELMRQVKQQYTDVIIWSEMFDSSPMDVKR